MIRTGYFYYVNSWLLAQGGYMAVFKAFWTKTAIIVVIAGLLIYTLKKNQTFEE